MNIVYNNLQISNCGRRRGLAEERTAGWTTWESARPCLRQNSLRRPPVERTGSWIVLLAPWSPSRSRDWTELNWIVLSSFMPPWRLSRSRDSTELNWIILSIIKVIESSPISPRWPSWSRDWSARNRIVLLFLLIIMRMVGWRLNVVCACYL